MTEQEVTETLSAALIECGIPKLAIDVGSNVRLPDGRILRADLVVVAADGETPLAVFEVKAAGALETIYGRAEDEVGDLTCLKAKGIKAFVVAPDAEGKPCFAQFAKACRRDGQWHPLAELRTAIGSYASQSLRIVERANLDEARLARFRCRTVGVGAVLLTVATVAEILGKEFSWKVYSLVVLVAALYAVSYGFSAKICLGGNEFSLTPKE